MGAGPVGGEGGCKSQRALPVRLRRGLTLLLGHRHSARVSRPRHAQALTVTATSSSGEVFGPRTFSLEPEALLQGAAGGAGRGRGRGRNGGGKGWRWWWVGSGRGGGGGRLSWQLAALTAQGPCSASVPSVSCWLACEGKLGRGGGGGRPLCLFAHEVQTAGNRSRASMQPGDASSKPIMPIMRSSKQHAHAGIMCR